MKRVTAVELKNIDELIKTAFSVISTEKPILSEHGIPAYIFADLRKLSGSGKELLTIARQFQQMYANKNTNVKKRSLSFYMSPLAPSRLYPNFNEHSTESFEQKLHSRMTESHVLYSKINLEIEKIVHKSLGSRGNELLLYEDKVEELTVVNHSLIRAIHNLSNTLADLLD